MELAKVSALQVQSLLATASMLSILILVLIVAHVLMLVLRAQSHQENNNRFPYRKEGWLSKRRATPFFVLVNKFFGSTNFHK